MFNCPNCGYPAKALLHHPMMTCASCQTTLVRNDDRVHNAGSCGQMHEAPLPFQLNDTVDLDGQKWNVLGHVRYDYGPGWWDEFWLERGTHNGCWVSFDEGDVIRQKDLAKKNWPKETRKPDKGSVLSLQGRGAEFTVVEVGTGTTIAFSGTFPEVIKLDERFDYVNAIGAGSQLLSGEFWDGDCAWFLGSYIDPFEITKSR